MSTQDTKVSIQIRSPDLSQSQPQEIFILPEASTTPPISKIVTDYTRHRYMLSNIIDPSNAIPLVYATITPTIPTSPNTTSSVSSIVNQKRYAEIDEQLTSLAELDEDGRPYVEAGALTTARQVMNYIRTNDITPPALSRLDDEAVVMLWGVGELKYLITVTEGEIGYVVRKTNETLRRKSGLLPIELDIYRLE